MTAQTNEQSTSKTNKPPAFIRAIGRRKTAVARVRLHTGKGDNLINNQSVSQYFPGIFNETIFLSPLRTANAIGKYHVTVKVKGGGKQAQMEAVAHGIARTLVKLDPNLKQALKKKNLITRDPRMKERRKAGFAQAARARKQSPKR
jgi:small subunit ribosomal protein S9